MVYSGALGPPGVVHKRKVPSAGLTSEMYEDRAAVEERLGRALGEMSFSLTPTRLSYYTDRLLYLSPHQLVE